MLDYTKFQVDGFDVWTRTLHLLHKKVKIDLNVTLVFSSVDTCTLGQSAQSIIPGAMYTSRSTGITKALETAVEKSIRDFLILADVADQTDEPLKEVVERVMQACSTFPPEKTSSLMIPIILTNKINFTNRLGHKADINVALLVPGRSMGVIVINRNYLEDWVNRMEEKIAIK